MRAVPTWVDKVHDRDRNEQVTEFNYTYESKMFSKYAINDRIYN